MSKSKSKSKKRAEKGMLVKWWAEDGRFCLCGLTNSVGGSADWWKSTAKVTVMSDGDKYLTFCNTRTLVTVGLLI